MTFDDLPPTPPSSGVGETRAFPKLTFEDMAKPPSPPPPSSSPWDEPAPTGGGETRAFPKMSFEDLQKPPATVPEAPSWDARPSAKFDEDVDTMPPTPSPSPAPSMWDEQPAGETRAFPKMSFEDLDKKATIPEPPKWTPPPAAEEKSSSASTGPVPVPSSSAPPASTSGELTEEQIDKIARRVVQLLSDQVVRNIAWEVIPDLAETVVKERIRQLESE